MLPASLWHPPPISKRGLKPRFGCQSLAGHAAGTDTPLERKGHRHASLFHDAWPVTSAMTWRDRDKR
ncbi:regulator of G-protein signaling 8 isoform C [Patagioenas fasciata monilis]|uniref:Regulator of G-protein signaling 8 isoform C n=1 Tax=Patagioenas fasciata monilis TaxID=372326 RepID=A0A1V4JXP5_PATFA|nr:regulator of G-protein signaling 8 isoform C [Patagioenas fasciata monilis]